ncbi:MAG: tetratricopeptide repeat protein [Burkholderiales bacterium]
MTGRNDPCPCGSGKRYKYCHGAVGAPAPAPAARTKEQWAAAGVEAHKRGLLDEAERCYRAALALDPGYAIALHYLGVATEQRGRPEEAMPLLDRAVELQPGEPEFHNNRGLALYSLQRDREAAEAHRRAIALAPRHAGAYSNLGRALQAAGDLEGAIAALRTGLAIAPEFPALHWNLGLALLLAGDYEAAWPEYEWRLRTPEFAHALPSYPGALWNGDDPAGKTLLVTSEQGLGDAIQFLRFARHVAARGARVVAMVPPALRRLAATAPGVAEAHAVGGPLPAYDAHVSLMSLPHRLGLGIDEIGMSASYLIADHARIDQARAAIDREGNGAICVGVAWSGAPGNTINARRSMPLAALAPLFDLASVRLFSLKRAGEAIDASDAAWSSRLVNLDMRNDFDGLAAMIASLDVVISVDTSIAHLAGALGKRVFVLNSFVPDWRWMLGRADSPWYPTARLFRQASPGDWSHPVASAARALREEFG